MEASARDGGSPGAPAPAPKVERALPLSARVVFAIEPVDNTDTYKIHVFKGAFIALLGDNASHVSSPDDLFVEGISEDGKVLWHEAGTARFARAISGASGHVFFASEFTGKLDFAGQRAYASNSAGFIAKLGDAGALTWGRVLATPSFTRLWEIAATPDGGVVAALGIFASAKKGPLAIPVAGGADAVIVKHDSSGEIAWVRGFNYPGYDDAQSVVSDASGNVFVAGTRWRGKDQWASSLGSDPCHGWVAKLGPGGEPQWIVDLGKNTTRVTVSHMVMGRDGGVIVKGTLLGKHRLGATDLEAKKEQGYLAALDRDGQVVEARLEDKSECIASDAGGRLFSVSARGIRVGEGAGEPKDVMSFGSEAISRITDCKLDGAGHLYVAGSANPGAKIGEVTLTGPMKKRPRTSWLKPYSVGFLAKIALGSP